METGRQRFTTDITKQIDNSHVSGANDTRGTQHQKKEKNDENDERVCSWPHRNESKRFAPTMSKGFIWTLWVEPLDC